jgi:UDP-N-acetylmuramate--alanine ligase
MLPALLAAQLQNNDMVITQGAGNIGVVARDLSSNSLLQIQQVKK